MTAHEYIETVFHALDQASISQCQRDWARVKRLFKRRPSELRHVKLPGFQQAALLYVIAQRHQVPRSYRKSPSKANLEKELAHAPSDVRCN